MINVVVSGVNFTSGGPLSIMIDFLKELTRHDDISVTALVHKKELYNELDSSKINFIELTHIKSSWLLRIKYEYFEFNKISRDLNPDIWFSMHDITPNVQTNFLVTYCHNPSPFYKSNLIDFILSYKIFLFSKFYKYLYKINIKHNDMVVVQQNWIKEKFEKMYKINNVYVARPSILIPNVNVCEKRIIDKNVFSFFYPSFPRVFKNFEIICKAVSYLNRNGVNNFNVFLTIDGTENIYTKKIVKKYKKIKNIKFIGLLKRDEVYNYYNNVNVLLFPSKLETWGLPISEFKVFNKPIIASSLDYAKETVGDYKKVNFFNPNSFKDLASLMESHLMNKVKYETNNYSNEGKSNDWSSFVELVKIKYNNRSNK